ncbi:hypothetical protein [Microbulbifer sp. SAOS-129_SWC]|uniref:hypothetical protein n=1 Tax=Microbulbifer sp. SAOS-129_SWC TaxID=3145235 RepID=UPI003216AD8A
MESKVLAVASMGGHWKQLLALIDAFEARTTVFASTGDNFEAHYGIAHYYCLPEASRKTPFRILWLLITAVWVVARERPDVVVSTGALPGLACILAGRLFGARTLWIDSIANVEHLSMSGKLARHIATTTLSQWPGLSRDGHVLYRGAIL